MGGVANLHYCTLTDSIQPIHFFDTLFSLLPEYLPSNFILSTDVLPAHTLNHFFYLLFFNFQYNLCTDALRKTTLTAL